MKRTFNIVLLWFISICAVSAQITSFGGKLEYRHTYTDLLNSGLLSTGNTRNPIFSLFTNGLILSRTIGSFNLSTNLNLANNSARSGELDYHSHSSSWNYYNASLNLLPAWLVNFSLSARAGRTETGANFSPAYSYIQRSKDNEQMITLSTSRIQWLPTTQVSYRRTHTYGVEGSTIDLLNKQYSFVLSSANGTSSINLLGTLSDVEDGISKTRSKVYNLTMDAVKEYNEKSRLDLSTQYDRYDAYGILSSSARYVNTMLDEFTSSTNLLAHNSSSTHHRAFSIGGTESVQFTPPGDFHYAMSFTGKGGKEIIYDSTGAKKYPVYEYTTLGNVTHSAGIYGANLSTNLSLSYSRQQIHYPFSQLGSGISNSLTWNVAGYNVSASHALSGGVQYNGSRNTSVTNTADLFANGRLWRGIMSSTGINYRDNRYTGGGAQYRNNRTLNMRQSLRTSYYYLVPFSAELSGTVNWYFTYITGRTYGWTFQFQSGSFFVQGLGLNYQYTRTFDPFYRFEIVNQTARMTYRWRMLGFELRLSQLNTIERRREVWFSIVRPF